MIAHREYTLPNAAAMLNEFTLGSPLSSRAYLEFMVETETLHANGLKAEVTRIPWLEIPGVASCYFAVEPAECQLGWVWEKGLKADRMIARIRELPPGRYFLQYTWDAAAGIFDAYVNGHPLRVAGTLGTPWAMGVHGKASAADGAMRINALASEARCLDERQALSRVPADCRGRQAGLFGGGVQGRMEIRPRSGAQPLYTSNLGQPGTDAGWILEGPGKIHFANGEMVVASSRPQGPDGHLVYWCPQVFPADFLAEWTVRPLSEHGLCIAFFCATGRRSRDLFDPALPARNGDFQQYIKGEVDAYHVSYYSNTPNEPGRNACNLRKNHGFYLVGNGPPGIAPGSRQRHKVRLLKQGARILLTVDDLIIIDATDDPLRYGPVFGPGRIGLRQMQWMQAAYRDFAVYPA